MALMECASQPGTTIHSTAAAEQRAAQLLPAACCCPASLALCSRSHLGLYCTGSASILAAITMSSSDRALMACVDSTTCSSTRRSAGRQAEWPAVQLQLRETAHLNCCGQHGSTTRVLLLLWRLRGVGAVHLTHTLRTTSMPFCTA